MAMKRNRRLFLEEIENRTVESLDRSVQSSAVGLKDLLQWTIIEDAEILDHATMQQASLRFRDE